MLKEFRGTFFTRWNLKGKNKKSILSFGQKRPVYQQIVLKFLETVWPNTSSGIILLQQKF